MQKKLSFQTFLISLALITVLSLAFIGILYYILNKDFQKPNWSSHNPVTTAPLSFNLEVLNPEDGMISFDDNILVSGKTAPGATVIISSNEKDFGLAASGKGEFSKVIDLSTGLNNLTITTFDSLGNSKTEEKAVYYSEEKL